jgi:hypothetical protein
MNQKPSFRLEDFVGEEGEAEIISSTSTYTKERKPDDRTFSGCKCNKECACNKMDCNKCFCDSHTCGCVGYVKLPEPPKCICEGHKPCDCDGYKEGSCWLETTRYCRND